VFVAGQYGSGPDGHTVSGDFADQAARAFENLGVALQATGRDYGNVVQLRTFIVDHDEAKLNVLVELIRDRWGSSPPTQTLIGVAALALPDMLFEVDAIAVTTSGR
jgi:enamine deaminase RidA (YjgF/YER057c/UK114 family)